MIEFKIDERFSPEQFVDILERSGLAERRPVQDRACIAKMLDHADLLITAWQDDLLIGVARSVTDFGYCCYLSDLAVDQSYQRQGVGLELLRRTRHQLDPSCTVILLAAPAATQYYPRVGFKRHENAWILSPGDPL
ncbi:MAG: GNAT family N-acetyltransferase [Anaerolineales bacterium]